MLWFLLACTVGPVEHASPESASAAESERLEDTQTLAGRLAGKSRELEAAAIAARQRMAAGSDPAAELAKLERLMVEIEAMDAELRTEHEALLERIRTQSTAATTE
jgi:hypothetical protein